MIGRLTEVIRVDVEVGQAPDEIAPIYREIARFRAEVKPGRATESEREAAVHEVQVYIFKVLTSALRAAPVTAVGHRIRWAGRTFNIREVRTPVAREPFTDIVAEAGVSL